MPLGNTRNPSLTGTSQLQQQSDEAPRTAKVKKRLSVTNGWTDTDLDTRTDCVNWVTEVQAEVVIHIVYLEYIVGIRP